ncbi:MAG: PD40 domain-containing protein [Acidobacteria bacterium]|nr:PD40 domain-containing protein [Acidobacteriota bacterium]
MKRMLFALALAGAALPGAGQAPPTRTEVTLESKSSGKLGTAVALPQVQGLDEAGVARDFHDVLKNDLEDAGPFAVLKSTKFPKGTEAATFKAWADLGTEWLIASKVSRTGPDQVMVALQVLDPKAGKPIFNKNYTGQEGGAILRRIAHTASDDLVARLTGERGVANTRIVFVRQVSREVKEIYQVDRDGGGMMALTRHGSLTISPTVAPDGRLAYITYKGGAPEIWGQKDRGGPHIKLYPVGTQPLGQCSAPSWSPDGKRLAFVQSDRRGNSDIMVLDISSGRVRRLTDSNCINTEPSWNPAGTQLAFTSDREGGPQVYLMEEDGSNVRRLTTEGTYNASPSWSPNGAMVAYVSRFEGKFDLFVFKLGEGKAYQITTGLTSSESPSWSPDERKLVFVSTRAGGMQLYTTDLSGSQIRKVMDAQGCQSPRWSRSR